MTELQESVSAVLITEEQIRTRVKDIGRKLSADYKGKNPVLIAVLRGAVVFTCDLMREISIPFTLDFLSISSYSGTTQTGVVKMIKDLDENIEGKHVLLVEDIVDTGFTLDYILRALMARKPADIRVCALLNKKTRRLIDVPVHYAGFEIPDKFVVGYGMDFNEKYRNLPFIGILNEDIVENQSQPSTLNY